MRVRAHAKINLSLRVLGVRADGYHELRTVFQSIALHDTITIRRVRGPFRLTVDDPACPSDATNLIWRAAERLWTASGRRGAPRDVAIDVAKRIPMQAGLGGGSSDAAAALQALGRLWQIDEALAREVGADLGADIPFFFEGGTVLGLGRGDLLFPLIDRPRAAVVLVLPDFGVSTREAFGWFDDFRGPERAAPQATAAKRDVARAAPRGTAVRRDVARAAPRDTAMRRDVAQAAPRGTAMRRDVARAFQARDPSRRSAVPQVEMVNDLEAPVVARHREIGRIISALRRAGADQAAMSGSGSAVFGLFSARTAAIEAARGVAGLNRSILVTRTVTRAQFRALARI